MPNLEKGLVIDRHRWHRYLHLRVERRDLHQRPVLRDYNEDDGSADRAADDRGTLGRQQHHGEQSAVGHAVLDGWRSDQDCPLSRISESDCCEYKHL